jgi:hypothetical protein
MLIPIPKKGCSMPQSAIVSELARETGVNEGDVKKVLDKLGLDAALAATKESGAANVSAKHAKLAFRTGKNTIHV